MADEILPIKYVKTLDNVTHPLDAGVLGGKPGESYQIKDNLVTTIGPDSDDIHYPSMKCLMTIIGDLQSLLEPEVFTLNSSFLDSTAILG